MTAEFGDMLRGMTEEEKEFARRMQEIRANNAGALQPRSNNAVIGPSTPADARAVERQTPSGYLAQKKRDLNAFGDYLTNEHLPQVWDAFSKSLPYAAREAVVGLSDPEGFVRDNFINPVEQEQERFVADPRSYLETLPNRAAGLLTNPRFQGNTLATLVIRGATKNALRNTNLDEVILGTKAVADVVEGLGKSYDTPLAPWKEAFDPDKLTEDQRKARLAAQGADRMTAPLAKALQGVDFEVPVGEYVKTAKEKIDDWFVSRRPSTPEPRKVASSKRKPTDTGG